MTTGALARRTFTREDQLAFAAASGDWNPMHMDAEAARRTQAGAPVVHGVHCVLWALEQVLDAEGGELPISGVRAQFHRFIHLDQVVTLAATRDGGRAFDLRVGDLTVATVEVRFGPHPAHDGDRFAKLDDTVLSDTPQVLAPEQMDGASGWLRPADGAGALTGAFPRLAAALGERRLVAMGLLSTLVGMACPGLHSIFSSFDLRVGAEVGERPGIGWRGRRADPRYARVDLSAAGSGIEAEVRALIRPAPVPPPTPADVAAQVQAGEFAGRRALVIGGSRGLGAATALLLAAGGADVTLTYAAGEAEAAALVEAIDRTWGEGRARALRYDVRNAMDEPLSRRLASATHLYYFATPHISQQGAGVFSEAAFEAFTDIYVRRFHALCRDALRVTGERMLDILYPSTVAIDDRPRGMTEYAMAKSAGEILCRDLMKSAPRLAIATPRLPRVLTDQTAIAIPVRAARAEEVMLPLLRAERPA